MTFEERLAARGPGEVVLPTLFANQVEGLMKPAPDETAPARFKAFRCGRRYGKTRVGETLACSDVLKGRTVGWFAPEYKFISEAYANITQMLAPIKKRSSETAGVFRALTGGRVDFWTLDNDNAGRSRHYHRVIIDEAAFTKPNMDAIWQRSIRPTLVDFEGKALVLSNTNGSSTDNWFWRICNMPEYEFVVHHAPSRTNPYLPVAELNRLQRESHPLVFKQEYEAEFVDWSGDSFFTIDLMLVDGNPVPYPTYCDKVFAVIDSAVKDGSEHDGTAVVYVARSQYVGHPLVILDYDLFQVKGAFIYLQLPEIFRRLEEYAVALRARYGSIGVFVEDKASGTIILQQGHNMGLDVHEIDSKMTSLGKSQRATNISSYIQKGMVKFSENAYNKQVVFKGISRNHLLSQIASFRIGDKEKRADDATDAWIYSIALALGNQDGF